LKSTIRIREIIKGRINLPLVRPKTRQLRSEPDSQLRSTLNARQWHPRTGFSSQASSSTLPVTERLNFQTFGSDPF